MNNSQPCATTDERRARRNRVLIGAVLVAHGRRYPVRMADLSSHGALVSGHALPIADSEIELVVAGKCVPGWIAWSQGDRAGIHFRTAIEPTEFGVRKGNTARYVVSDARERCFKRPGFKAVQLTAEEQSMIDAYQR